jgi:recombination protein RecA
MIYGEGISRTGEIIDLGVDHDIVGKSGSWYSYNGTKIAQGRESAKQFLLDNPELMEEIADKITQHYLPGAVADTKEVMDIEEKAEV